MLSRRARTLLLAGGVLAAVLPAIGSHAGAVLPPGFGDPKAQPPPPPTPPPTPTPTNQPTTPDPTATPDTPGLPTTPVERVDRPVVVETRDSAQTDLELLPPPPPPPFYDLPEGAERPVDLVGVINATNRGLPIDAFGNASGPFLATLMQRLDAPVPSRWTQILLRRALMSRVSAPAMIDPVDFVAERVRLLVRMGEADAARMLAQAIDVVSYNPNMVRAAYEASMASADPAGLCPLVQKGREAFQDAAWPLADAICAAMEGEGARASTLLDEARSKGARGIDLLLAEKLVSAGTNTRRAVEIQWDEVSDLSIWRYGLSAAAGAAAPERLLGGANGARMQAWLARAPMVPVTERLAAADTAAVMGVFSSASLVDAHALALELREQEAERDGEEATDIASRLRSAFTGEEAGRVAAMRRLWEEAGEDGTRRYARLILTAGAARQVAPSGDHPEDMDEIVASLLAAGMDGEAAAWSGAVEEQGGSSLAWALLAVGGPRLAVDVDGGRIEAFAGGATGALRAQMLAAALAGLGRADESVAQGLGVETAQEDDWTRALDRAASAGQGGTVALLAAVGMQASDWSAVPPNHLYRIVRALRQVGLEFEARMIAAEALTRL
jgi:hypothetical protein